MDFKIVTCLVHPAPALGTEFDGTAEKISDIQLGFDVILSLTVSNLETIGTALI